MATVNTEIGRGRHRQTFFSKVYGSYLRLAVADILKRVCKTVRDVHTLQFDYDGMRAEEKRAGCRNFGKTATVALGLISAEKLYLAVRRECFLEKMTERLAAVLNCPVALCSPYEKMNERLKSTGLYELKLRSRSAEDELQIREKRKSGEERTYEDWS